MEGLEEYLSVLRSFKASEEEETGRKKERRKTVQQMVEELERSV